MTTLIDLNSLPAPIVVEQLSFEDIFSGKLSKFLGMSEEFTALLESDPAIKVLEAGTAVNITLGLPFIRTSPDHGTAFDRAGRWAADPENTLHAADLALRLIQRRKA